MSKYNHIKSIPIDSIPKKELKRAIHEWAEGDDAMERLLWACYDNNIETSGCHAGGRPYIAFKRPKNIDKLISLFEVTEKAEDSQVIIMVDGGNPLSGPEWYLPSIGIGINTMYQDEADKYFDDLTKEVNKDVSNKTHPMIDLLDFFLDKETGLMLRLRHTKDNKYIFTIEAKQSIKERIDYYNNIFTNSGLEEKPYNHEVCPYYEWYVEDNNLDEIINKMNNITKYIINNYSLDPETKEENIKNFVLLARFKRKELTQEELEKYLNNYLKERQK